LSNKTEHGFPELIAAGKASGIGLLRRNVSFNGMHSADFQETLQQQELKNEAAVQADKTGC
jgi:hypothetical protein